MKETKISSRTKIQGLEIKSIGYIVKIKNLIQHYSIKIWNYKMYTGNYKMN